MTPFLTIFRLSRPIQLLLALLAYGLGLGIAHYLGAAVRVESQLVGGLVILLLLTGSNLLTEYFRPLNEPLTPDETRLRRQQVRAQLLTVSAALIAVASLLAIVLWLQKALPLNAALLLVTFLLLGLSNATPPLRLAERGFGELIQALLLAVLTPAIAFLLQVSQPHRLLTIFTFPLFMLALAYLLALSFERYSDDLKYERPSLLIRLTWQRAVPVHNGLLLTAYLLLAAAPFFATPFSLIWPALLTLPIAGCQIFTLRNIAEGARPAWAVFTAVATSVFGLTLYLLMLTFWLR